MNQNIPQEVKNEITVDKNGPSPQVSEKNSPWIMSIDNIFVDVARDFPDNKFLEDNQIIPGTQNTALTDELKRVA